MEFIPSQWIAIRRTVEMRSHCGIPTISMPRLQSRDIAFGWIRFLTVVRVLPSSGDTNDSPAFVSAVGFLLGSVKNREQHPCHFQPARASSGHQASVS